MIKRVTFHIFNLIHHKEMYDSEDIQNRATLKLQIPTNITHRPEYRQNYKINRINTKVIIINIKPNQNSAVKS